MVIINPEFKYKEFFVKKKSFIIDLTMFGLHGIAYVIKILLQKITSLTDIQLKHNSTMKKKFN